MKEICLVTIDGLTRQARSALEMDHKSAEWFVSAEDYNSLRLRISKMERALEIYADHSRWNCREIHLGNGTTISAPGLGMGPSPAIEALVKDPL